ncbi:MAG: Stp1/IreP family PP2C-type Ser/Thr phosphatase, partial [Gemmatimonadaceae bacterium]
MNDTTGGSDNGGAVPNDVVISVFGRTDVGRTREHNEDAFIVADLTTNTATLEPDVRRHAPGPKGSLFMVADGMGGAAAGEIASAMAVEIVLAELRATWVGRPDARGSEGFARALKQATRAANDQINAYASRHQEYRGMGTTATIAGFLGDTLYVAQVGDSRAYLVRDGVARQITKDQSLMQKLIEAGELTEEEAEHSERRNIILQALGPEPSIKVDLTHQIVRRGDALVLCSDGLSGQVTKDDIARVVRETPNLIDACKGLIELANAAGGPDNITVIIARFDGKGLEPPAHADEVGHRVFPLPDTGPIAIPADAITPTDTPRVESVASAEREASGSAPDAPRPSDAPRGVTHGTTAARNSPS